MDAERTRWRLKVSGGFGTVWTVNEHTPAQLRYRLKDGDFIECETTELLRANRRRWFVNGGHVVAATPFDGKGRT